MNASFAATVFHVTQVAHSIDFYVKVLGFDHSFRVGDYAGVCSGEVMIHLCGPANNGYNRPIGSGHLCITIDAVDDFYSYLKQQQVEIIYPIGDRDYGIRDFSMRDPDGNILVFGSNIC